MARPKQEAPVKRRKKGQGSVRVLDNGKATYRYTDPNGKRMELTAANEDDAYDKLNEVLVLMKKGEYIEPSTMTLGEWIVTWMNTYKRRTIKPQSFYNYSAMYRFYIKETIGKIQLDKLKGDDIQGWINDMDDNDYSISTIRLAYGVVRGSLEKAYQLDRISRMPTKAVELPTGTKSAKQILSTESYNKLIKNASKYNCGDIVLLMLGTGVRPGEALALRWSDIDFKKEVIHIQSNRQQIGILDDELKVTSRQTLQQESTKSKSGNRTIPMLGFTKELLLRLNARRMNITHVCVNSRGQVPSSQRFVWAVEELLKAEGIPRVTPHALRHTFATQAVKNGIDYKTLQKILGHATLAMTMDMYVQVDDDMMRREMMKTVK